MKRSRHPYFFSTIGILVVAALMLGLGVMMVFKAHARKVAAPAPAEVVAVITSVKPVSVTVPLTVTAWGDVAPAQAESISLPRSGQLVAVAVVVGQRVHKGNLLARVAGDPASEAGYTNAQSALKLAQAESSRLQAMLKLQLATVSQLDAAHKAEFDARSVLDALRKTGVGEGESIITAPFEGVVTAQNAALGDRLTANAPILQLGRVDLLRINLGIEPAQRPNVHVGDLVSLAPLASRPSDDHAESPGVQGRIASLQDLVDPKTQLVSAVAQVPPASASKLVLGMRVQADIAIGSAAGWRVPRLAVLQDDQGSYLYQVRAGIAHRVAVKPKAQVQGDVAVAGPLDAALPVVSVGNYELSDGMKVTEAAK